MPEIPKSFTIDDDVSNSVFKVGTKINQIITYLHADKKLRDEQYAAVANFAEKTKTPVDEIPMFAGTREQLDGLSVRPPMPTNPTPSLNALVEEQKKEFNKQNPALAWEVNNHLHDFITQAMSAAYELGKGEVKKEWNEFEDFNGPKDL